MGPLILSPRMHPAIMGYVVYEDTTLLLLQMEFSSKAADKNARCEHYIKYCLRVLLHNHYLLSMAMKKQR